MKISNRFVMGSALSLAAFLTAIDHTRSPVPQAQAANESLTSTNDNKNNPCSLQAAPCSLDIKKRAKNKKDNPCALESSSPQDL